MTEMTPKELASKIKKLKAKPLGATQYERELVARGIWSANGVWYTSQKEHWLGWLSEYDGPGAYDRKTWRGRSAKYIYNHIQSPSMLIWLAEAIGISKAKLKLARCSALSGPHNKASHCAKVRKIIPWQEIEGRL
jgi:hypothetical protein